MVALRWVFVILSRRSVSAVSVGVSAKRPNGPMSRAGEMLDVKIDVTAVTKSAAGMSRLKKRIVGAALKFDGFVAAIDLRGNPRV
ncbi:hypothetical protein [Microvirga zambiensis]|uniref:hypothetical protein n=1 Tax=Microvirga zambiensis TaxID=1402137 RepID=UPI001AEF525A|nr:hypothetical protein [Microvirga zambiensis]